MQITWSLSIGLYAVSEGISAEQLVDERGRSLVCQVLAYTISDSTSAERKLAVSSQLVTSQRSSLVM